MDCEKLLKWMMLSQMWKSLNAKVRKLWWVQLRQWHAIVTQQRPLHWEVEAICIMKKIGGVGGKKKRQTRGILVSNETLHLFLGCEGWHSGWLYHFHFRQKQVHQSSPQWSSGSSTTILCSICILSLILGFSKSCRIVQGINSEPENILSNALNWHFRRDLQPFDCDFKGGFSDPPFWGRGLAVRDKLIR